MELPIHDLNWFSCSDNFDGGNSIAEIQKVSDNGLKALLIPRVSELDSSYAFIGFPWTPGRELNAVGLEIKMFLARGKILAVHFPLSTSMDDDLHHTEILGEGEKSYRIYFHDLRQGSFGKKNEWNLAFLKEIRFFNGYIKNDIHIEIREIHLLLPNEG